MHIVVLDGHTLNPGDLSWNGLKTFGKLTVYDRTAPEEALERAATADILLVNKFVLDADLIGKLDRLKYVVVTATGYNNIDMDACASAKIPVSNVTNYGSVTVAQHVFALLLALTNRVEHHAGRVRDGAWSASGVFSFWDAPIVELAGKTMGVIGYGHIGREVARIAGGFSMDVIYYSASGSTPGPDDPEGFKAVPLDRLIEHADVISLNTHLHDGNRGMVDHSFLQRMKPSAYLINTARGGLIRETELAEALEAGIIAGAGLDVLSEEPPPDDHILLHAPNCIITPHNAWASVEARRRMMDIVAENIHAWQTGEPINLVG